MAVLEFICCVILLYLPYNMARFTRQWNRRTKITSISTGKQNKTILASQNTSQVSWSKYKEWTKQWHIYQIHQLCQSIVFQFNLINLLTYRGFKQFLNINLSERERESLRVLGVVCWLVTYYACTCKYIRYASFHQYLKT